MTDDRRRDVLDDLLDLRVELGAALHALADLGWGQDEVVDLTPTHLLGVLQRLVDGRLTAADVTAWADAVEMRDDIGRAPGTEDVVNDTLLEMSSPELFDDLTEAAPALIRQLESAR